MSSTTSPKQRAVVIGLIVLGILFTIFFGMRAFHAFRKFNGHRPPSPGKIETDVELIRDWMTISFISKMYHVPEKTIFDTLNITPLGSHDKSLKELNDDYFPDQDGFVLERVKAAILAHQPPPPPDASPAPVTP
jgi:hypothetical protein